MVTSILAGPRIADVLFFCAFEYLFTGDVVVGIATYVFPDRSGLVPLVIVRPLLGPSVVRVEATMVTVVPGSVIDSVVRSSVSILFLDAISPCPVVSSVVGTVVNL